MRYFPFVLAATLTVGFSATHANAQDKHVTTINQCTVIDKPGAYEVGKVIQAGNLNPVPIYPGISACIFISADFVTLDLGGNTIIGPGSGGSVGVLAAQDRKAVRIHSGNVTNFGAGVVNGASEGRTEHISAFDNVSGGIVVATPIPNSRAAAQVIGNIANRNGGNGIQVEANARVIGNVAADNGNFGIIVIGCPSVVLENLASNNTPGRDLAVGVPNCTRSHNSPNIGDLP